MSDALKGQVAIVVGASSGMGRAIVAALADAGAAVMAAARREDRLRQLQAEMEGLGKLVDCEAVDVTVRAEVDRLIDTTLRHFGKIDLLVYASGTNIRERSLQVLSVEDWNMMLATNLTGAFHCTQAVLPAMRAAKNGLIVYISTAAVQMPDVSGVAYQASKHGLSGLAHGTRIEEKANGIRASLIFPGLCDTEILTKRPQPTPQEVLALALDPADIAAAVLFIASLPPRAIVPELQLFPSRL